MTSWFADRIFRRLFRNASWLISGNAAGAAVGLANMAITTRILGLESFGIFVLITTYAAIFDRLFNFQIWQGLIQYGAAALHDKDDRRFGQLVKFGVCLDVGGATAGVLAALALAPVVGGYMAFTDRQIAYTALFSLVIITNLGGVPTGVLRLYDRYSALAFQKAASSAAILLLLLPALWIGAGLGQVLAIYALGQIAGNVYLLASGWKALRDHGHSGFRRYPLRGFLQANTGIVRFIFYTNIESSVKILRQVDIFIIKLVVNAEAVGIYRIARRLAETLSMAIDPFFQAIYPELARFHAAKDRQAFTRLVRQSAILVGGGSLAVWMGFLVCGPWLVPIAFGEDFAPAYLPASICLLAMVVWAAAQPLSPALYVMGHMRAIYYSHLVTALLYLAALYPMMTQWGMTGAAAAFMLFFAAWSTAMAVLYAFKKKKEFA